MKHPHLVPKQQFTRQTLVSLDKSWCRSNHSGYCRAQPKTPFRGRPQAFTRKTISQQKRAWVIGRPAGQQFPVLCAPIAAASSHGSNLSVTHKQQKPTRRSLQERQIVIPTGRSTLKMVLLPNHPIQALPGKGPLRPDRQPAQPPPPRQVWRCTPMGRLLPVDPPGRDR
jgi:hypothetical protein